MSVPQWGKAPVLLLPKFMGQFQKLLASMNWISKYPVSEIDEVT
jgi:hypothetical protein